MKKIYIYHNDSDFKTYWFLAFYLYFKSIHEILVSNGIPCEIINDTSLLNEDDILVLFPPWKSNFDVHNCKYKIIFINSEPLYVKKYEHLKEIINCSSVIFWGDYTNRNLNALYNISKPLKNIPFFWSPFCEFHFNSFIKSNNIENEKKDIDVLFYGGINNRRRKILSELINKGLKVVSTTQKFDNIYKMMNRSKLVIVIHFYDEDTPVDYYRIAPLISNKIFFIHEEIQEEDINLNNEKIIFSKYKCLVEDCVKYLNMTQKERDNISTKCYNFYKLNNHFEKSIPIELIKSLL